MSGSANVPPFWAADPDAVAGEYVLGTLPLEERAAFAEALDQDASLRATVLAWETRLGRLTDMIAAVPPEPRVWIGIEARIASQTVLRSQARKEASAGEARILQLERELQRWRLGASIAGALAASLAVWTAVGPLPATRDAQYVAVVDRGGALPALIVRVDLDSGTVQVRSLAAEAPPDRSLELWYVTTGAAPRSLGLVTNATARIPVPVALSADVKGVKLAVSVEPKGGSPTGAPTGPVIYSGQLMRD
ncbi:Regulator of SigK [Methylorubrum aminovorans]